MPEENHDLYIGVKNDLSPFYVDLNALTRSLVVIGQSGCGKSFMLGRLVEEIIRKTTTKTQLMIIDPNSDFYYGLKPDESEFNDKINYYYSEELKNQHTEFKKKEKTCYDDFERKVPDARVFRKIEDFKLNWEFITKYPDKYFQLIKANNFSSHYLMAFILLSHHLKNDKNTLQDWRAASTDYIAISKDIQTTSEYMDINEEKLKILKLSEFNSIAELSADLILESMSHIWREEHDKTGLPDEFVLQNINIICVETIPQKKPKIKLIAYILSFFFNLYKQYTAGYREAVIKRDEKEIIKMKKELKHTFILIDEVHNFAPEDTNDPHEKMLGELIHQIAAEGRKYGLHLILATQRPNKVKRGLLGECDNAIIMKMNSRSDLEYLANEMRILDVKLLESCLHFQGKGNALAIGEMTRMAPYVQVFKSAPRRTVEGGVDIKEF